MPETIIVRPETVRRRPPGLTRRRVLQIGFWSSIGALMAGAAASTINALWPRRVGAFGGPVAVPAAVVPRPGDPPLRLFAGHFFLVNLEPGEGLAANDDRATDGGLLALWWKCPHLGCTLPWKPEFVSPADELGRRGWFNCNCHGSTYTKAGVLIYGPAPRSMDRMKLEVGDDGTLTVQTGEIEEGSQDNALRAVPWSRPAGGLSASGPDHILTS